MTKKRAWVAVGIALVAGCTSYEKVADESDAAPDTSSACDPTAVACTLTTPICGCQAKQNCVLVTGAAQTTACVAEGTAGLNQRCVTQADCAKGFFCVIDNNRSDGLCTPYCGADKTCAVGKPLNVTAELCVCLSECDPIDDTSCLPDGACLFTGAITTGCLPAGTGTGVGGCSGGNHCAAGYACDGANCHRWCQVGTNNCPGGAACIDQGKTYGGTKIGACPAS